MSFLHHQGGFVDIRLLHLNLPHLGQDVCLHLICRPATQQNKSHTNGTAGRAIAGGHLFFLLRELDDKILRDIASNPTNSQLTAKNEIAVRNIINNTCRNNHVWCTIPELKALKSLGVLPTRTPKASLIDPFTTVRLLRHFHNDTTAMCLSSVVISLSAEARLYSEFFLNLKSAVFVAMSRFSGNSSLLRNQSEEQLEMTPQTISQLSQALQLPKLTSTFSILGNMSGIIGYQPSINSCFTTKSIHEQSLTTHGDKLTVNDRTHLPKTASDDLIDCAACEEDDGYGFDDEIYFYDNNSPPTEAQIRFAENISREAQKILQSPDYLQFHGALNQAVTTPSAFTPTPNVNPTRTQNFTENEELHDNSLVKLGVSMDSINSNINNDSNIHNQSKISKISTKSPTNIDNNATIQNKPNDGSEDDDLNAQNERIALQVRNLAMRSVVTNRNGNTFIHFSYALGDQPTPFHNIPPQFRPCHERFRELKARRNEILPEQYDCGNSVNDMTRVNLPNPQSYNSPITPQRVLTSLVIRANMGVTVDSSIDDIVIAFRTIRSPSRALANLVRLIAEDGGQDDAAHVIKCLHLARAARNEGLQPKIEASSTALKNSIMAALRKVYGRDISSYSMMSLSDDSSLYGTDQATIKPPYLMFQHKPSLTMLPMMLAHKPGRQCPHILFTYPELIMEAMFLNMIKNGTNLEKITTPLDPPPSQPPKRAHRRAMKPTINKPQVHPAYAIAAAMHSSIMRNNNPTDFQHSLVLAGDNLLLSFPGIVNFQFLFALTFLSLKFSFPYHLFDSEVISYYQYCSGLINQAMVSLLTTLKQPLVFVITLVEFSQDELNSFFKDSNYPRYDDKYVIPDAILISDTPVNGDHSTQPSHKNQHSNENDHFEPEPPLLEKILTDSTNSMSIATGFDHCLSAVDHFPYDITQTTLPLFLSFLNQIESLPPNQLLRLWRYMGRYFTHEYSPENEQNTQEQQPQQLQQPQHEKREIITPSVIPQNSDNKTIINDQIIDTQLVMAKQNSEKSNENNDEDYDFSYHTKRQRYNEGISDFSLTGTYSGYTNTAHIMGYNDYTHYNLTHPHLQYPLPTQPLHLSASLNTQSDNTDLNGSSHQISSSYIQFPQQPSPFNLNNNQTSSISPPPSAFTSVRSPTGPPSPQWDLSLGNYSTTPINPKLNHFSPNEPASPNYFRSSPAQTNLFQSFPHSPRLHSSCPHQHDCTSRNTFNSITHSPIQNNSQLQQVISFPISPIYTPNQFYPSTSLPISPDMSFHNHIIQSQSHDANFTSQPSDNPPF